MGGAAANSWPEGEASKLHGQEQQRSAAARNHKHTPHSTLTRCTSATHGGDTALFISVHTSYSVRYDTSWHMEKCSGSPWQRTLIVAVLPPVFGPVMITQRVSGRTHTSIATGGCASASSSCSAWALAGDSCAYAHAHAELGSGRWLVALMCRQRMVMQRVLGRKYRFKATGSCARPLSLFNHNFQSAAICFAYLGCYCWGDKGIKDEPGACREPRR